MNDKKAKSRKHPHTITLLQAAMSKAKGQVRLTSGQLLQQSTQPAERTEIVSQENSDIRSRHYESGITRPPDKDAKLNDLAPLALAQLRDDLLIRHRLYDGPEIDDRRKRSLKFRAKQRTWRTAIFNDPFHRKDRSKNLNKVTAARRRKRDGAGKFNLEQQIEEAKAKKAAAAMQTQLDERKEAPPGLPKLPTITQIARGEHHLQLQVTAVAYAPVETPMTQLLPFRFDSTKLQQPPVEQSDNENSVRATSMFMNNKPNPAAPMRQFSDQMAQYAPQINFAKEISHPVTKMWETMPCQRVKSPEQVLTPLARGQTSLQWDSADHQSSNNQQ